MEKSRNTGRTFNQIKNAPQGAIFVWCSHDTSHPTRLARMAGRTDLSIRPSSWLDWRNVAGLEIPNVVIDHAARISGKGTQDVLMRLKASGTVVVL